PDPGAEREEGSHGPEVAVRLVLHLSESARRIPQVQRALQPLDRVDQEVDLGVGSDPARRLKEGEQRQGSADQRIVPGGASQCTAYVVTHRDKRGGGCGLGSRLAQHVLPSGGWTVGSRQTTRR